MVAAGAPRGAPDGGATAKPQDVTALFVRRAVDLRRFENELRRRTVSVLGAARADLAEKLLRLDPTATAFRQARLRALFRQTNDSLRSAYQQIGSDVRGQLRGLAANQVRFTTDGLRRALGEEAGAVVRSVATGPAFLASIVDSNPIRGAVLGEWWAKQSRDAAFAFRSAVQTGLVENETIGQIVQRIRGAPGELGVLAGSGRGAEALVRTAVNQVANDAQYETLAANEDVTQEYEYVATLDADTTPICMSLDGRRWRYDDPAAKTPPQHVGCRSIVVAVVSWEKLGVEPPPEGSRAARGGTVPSSTKYGEWLRRQPAEVQNEVLGVGKAELFRSDGISLRDLVRSDGTVASLAELEQRVAAGIPPSPAVIQSVEQQFAREIVEAPPVEPPAAERGPALAGREAVKALDAAFRVLPKRTSEAEAARFYLVEGGDKTLNSTLRAASSGAEFVATAEARGFTADFALTAERQMHALDGLMQHVPPLPADVEVWRGVRHSSELVGSGTLAERAERLRGFVGRTIEDKAFVSTTTSRAQAESWAHFGREGQDAVLFRIRAPQGSRGAWMRSVNPAAQREAVVRGELLLPRGSRFRVLGVEILDEVRAIIDVELVP